MTIHIITRTESDTHIEVVKDLFAIITVDQRADSNGLWLKLVHKDPTKSDTWIEYDPDYDTISVIE